MRAVFAVLNPAPEEDGGATLSRRLVAAAQIGAAALVGFGLILWIAANWNALGRFGQFGLVGAVIVAATLLAALFRPARAPALLVALFATGGLLALFGQTYQTGADPWTLFMLWAALGLPWAIAARHDAVWSVWTIVAFTGLPLWVAAQAGTWDRGDVLQVLPAWLIGGAIALALSPLAGLTRWIGSTRCAFRIAIVLLLGLIVSLAVASLFGRVQVLYLLGLVIVAAMIAGFWAIRPLDLPLMTAVALAADVLLIGGLYRLLFFFGNANDFGAFLVAGLLSAGIVGASAAALLHLAKSVPAPASPEAAPVADLQNPEPETEPSRWPIAVLSGIGALFAALPLWLFYGSLFGWVMRSAIGALIIGVATIAGALLLLAKAPAISFRQQFGFVTLVTGLGVVGFGLFMGLPPQAACLAMALAVTALAWWLDIAWVRGLLGAAAAGFIAAALIMTAGRGSALFSQLIVALTPALLAIAGAIGLLALGRTTASTPQPTGFLPQAAAPFVIGWLAATIAALIVFSGSTFLLAGSLPWGRGLPRGETAMAIGTVLSVLSAMAAGCMLYLARPALRTILGYALAAVSLILAYLLPTFGPCLLIAAVGLLTGQRALAVFAAFGALWSLGSLYYMLHMTLAQKALVISATGVALGAVTFAAGVTLPKRAPAARPVSSGSPLIAAALIALGTAATAGMVGYGIIGNEHIIATGDRLYIRLAPVDPRSLIQGDYMALRFDLPERGRVKDPASRMQAVATLDPQRVAKVLRLEVSPARLAPGEIAIDLKLKSGAWMVASDAWFFREGDGPRFEKARYGEFRLLQNGKVLLVGMADEALQAIR